MKKSEHPCLKLTSPTTNRKPIFSCYWYLVFVSDGVRQQKMVAAQQGWLSHPTVSIVTIKTIITFLCYEDRCWFEVWWMSFKVWNRARSTWPGMFSLCNHRLISVVSLYVTLISIITNRHRRKRLRAPLNSRHPGCVKVAAGCSSRSHPMQSISAPRILIPHFMIYNFKVN